MVECPVCGQPANVYGTQDVSPYTEGRTLAGFDPVCLAVTKGGQLRVYAHG